MPANLTPQYLAAEERYKQTKEDRERLKALKEMLATVPKHKGTEKLQGDIKRKIAKLRDELEDHRSKKGARRFSFHVDKEGAGQLTVIGPPNVGKTQLVNALAQVSLEVGDYPFTTRIFQPAMMPFEDIQIQLIDLPGLSRDYMETWVPTIIKGSDAALIVLDSSRDDLLDQMDTVLMILQTYKIELIDPSLPAKDPRCTFLKSLVIANKNDLPLSRENYGILKEFYGETLTFTASSAKNQSNFDELKRQIVQLLNIIRVYSKRPGYPAELESPFVFPRKSTLLDFAKAVHKDFSEHLKFARVWSSHKYEGQRITRDYILEDGDIIELHI